MARRAPEPVLSSPRRLIEAMREGVIVTDLRGRILAVNHAFCRVTGYSRAEAIGSNPRMLQSGRQGPPFYRAMWSSILRRGGWSGEIWNRRKNGQVYAEWLSVSTIRDAKGRPLRYLGVFSDITSRKASEERLRSQGRYDPLTELPNRRMLEEALAAAVRMSGRAGGPAVLFVDLDGFKRINDAHGHAVGDLLLRAAAGRLRTSVRGADLVGRWGGDEFVVLLSPAAGRAVAARVGAKIVRVLGRPFAIHGLRLRVGASVGFSVLEERRRADRLIRDADRAMYEAKRLGGGRVSFAHRARRTPAARARPRRP